MSDDLPAAATLAGVLPTLLAGAAAGLAMGGAYFAVLWASVRRVTHRPPGAWFVAALVGRLALALAVLVVVARWGGGPALLGALLGFLFVRIVLLRRLRSATGQTGRRP